MDEEAVWLWVAIGLNVAWSALNVWGFWSARHYLQLSRGMYVDAKASLKRAMETERNAKP